MKLLLGDPKRIIRWAPTRALAFWAQRTLTPAMKEWVKTTYYRYRRIAPAPVYTPSPQQMALYSAKCRILIAHAKAELGYRPINRYLPPRRAQIPTTPATPRTPGGKGLGAALLSLLDKALSR